MAKKAKKGKCLRYKKIRKKVCTDWVGGNKHKPGNPGKHCKKFKIKTVRVCADYKNKKRRK